MSAGTSGPMTPVEKAALTAIAAAVVLGTLAYGVFRLYGF